MKRNRSELPAEAIALARDGRIVEAIKVVREHRWSSLKEAKDAIDAYVRDPDGVMPLDDADRAHTEIDVPRLAVRALENGQLLEAIKCTREATGSGPKDAKETVERYLEAHPEVNSQFKSASAAAFKCSAGKLVFILALLGLVALGYQFFFGLGP